MNKTDILMGRKSYTEVCLVLEHEKSNNKTSSVVLEIQIYIHYNS